jgi:hypothetical protein
MKIANKLKGAFAALRKQEQRMNKRESDGSK